MIRIVIVAENPNKKIIFDNDGFPKNYRFEKTYGTKKETIFKISIFPRGSLALKFPKNEDSFFDSRLWYAPTEKQIFELGDKEIIKIYKQIDAENKKQKQKGMG